jgi:hypothetical protein
MLDTVAEQRLSIADLLPHLGHISWPGSSVFPGAMPHFPCNICKGEGQASDDVGFVDMPPAFLLTCSTAGGIVSPAPGDKDIRMNIVANTEASQAGTHEIVSVQDPKILCSMFSNNLIT